MKFRNFLTSVLVTLTSQCVAASDADAISLQAQADKMIFAWGADAGGMIDMSGNDMSAFTIDAYFGCRNGFIDIIGAGAGIDMMTANSSRIFPIYGIIRTSFRSRPSLCFMDLRAGCAINNLADNTNRTTAYLSPGVGFNLATGRKFKSYLVVAYTYNSLTTIDAPESNVIEIRHGLHEISARIGITF